MSITTTLLDVTTDTFQSLINKVNGFANAFSNYVVTTDNTATGSVTTGNAYVNGTFSADTLAVRTTLRGGNVSSNALLTIDTGVNIGANSSIVSGFFSTSSNAAGQNVDSYSISTFRSAKYLAQVTTAVGSQTSELIVTHNGSVSFLTEYAVVTSNGLMGTFSGAANATSVILQFNPLTSSAVNNVNFQRTTLAI